MDNMQVDSNDSQAKLIVFKPITITPEPTITTNIIIKPTPINKLHSISPEPLLKRMRLF
jgi:hypothetical protein